MKAKESNLSWKRKFANNVFSISQAVRGSMWRGKREKVRCKMNWFLIFPLSESSLILPRMQFEKIYRFTSCWNKIKVLQRTASRCFPKLAWSTHETRLQVSKRGLLTVIDTWISDIGNDNKTWVPWLDLLCGGVSGAQCRSSRQGWQKRRVPHTEHDTQRRRRRRNWILQARRREVDVAISVLKLKKKS